MNPEELREARQLDCLLDALLDLPWQERQRRLAQLQVDQPLLARKLERLIELAEEDSAALRPAGALKAGILDEWVEEGQAPLAAGDVFCGYHIEALAGSGGMSNVYRARRDFQGFATTVALKLIRRHGSSAIGSDVLRLEQRALARLEHPGIARFIDAGEGPHGELYLAMEYVDGESILDHADRRRLDLRGRVRLLIALCRSLEHAHARRLVHGDVKSANVLVDREGRLRLVDFGIASDGSMEAEDRVRAFTPECAAPEQISGTGVTTATDVFQVGALAYRLLGGRSRLHGQGGAHPHEDGVLAPSRMLVDASREAGDAIARLRGFSGRKQLQRALDGDLDAIILNCLHPDPEQRYASMSDLREDFENWTGVRCVLARPQTIRLRTVKFLRRNATAASTIGLLLLLALVAGVLSLTRLRQAEIERLAEAERAIQVERYMSEMIRAASPYLRAESSDPLATIAAVGASLLEADAELDYRSRARLGLSLAQLQLARSNYRQADELLVSVDDALKSGPEEQSLLRAEWLSAKANVAADEDQTGESIVLQQQAVAAWKAAMPDSVKMALAQAQLGDFLRRAGRMEEAEIAFDEAVPVILDGFSALDTDRVRVIGRYVRLLGQRGRLDDMRSLRTSMLVHAESNDGRGVAQAELSAVLAEMDSVLTSPAVAAERFEDAASRFEALLGDKHLRVASILIEACVSRLESGQLARAKALCLRSLGIYEGKGEAESYNAAIALNNLASIANNSGSVLEADLYAERSGLLFERHQQPFAQLQNHLLQARIALSHGRSAKVLAHLDEAEELRKQLQMDNSELVLEHGQLRVFALVAAGRLEDAEIVMASVEPILSAMLPADRARNKAWTEVARAQLASARKQTQELEAAISSALSSYRETPGRNDLEQGWIYADLAASAVEAGLLFKAAELAGAALGLLSAEEHGVHWANAWAVRRVSGGVADSEKDALARDVLTTQQVDTQLARTFLSLR